VDPWRVQLSTSRVWTYQLTLPLGGVLIRTLRLRPLHDAFLYGAPILLVLLWSFGWARGRVRKTPTPVCR
jgi:hypothetical protein